MKTYRVTWETSHGDHERTFDADTHDTTGGMVQYTKGDFITFEVREDAFVSSEITQEEVPDVAS